MHIERARQASLELLEAMRRLIPQLGQHLKAPTRDDLEALIGSEAATLLVARFPDEEGGIVGILSLTIYRVPSGVHSIVEDLVVDASVRRRGIGEGLLRHAIDLARAAGANAVSLTSNPRREAANRLYQSVGFEQRSTNAYLYRLG